MKASKQIQALTVSHKRVCKEKGGEFTINL